MALEYTGAMHDCRVERATREQRKRPLLHLGGKDPLSDGNGLNKLERAGNQSHRISGEREADGTTLVWGNEECIAIFNFHLFRNRGNHVRSECLRHGEAELAELVAELEVRGSEAGTDVLCARLNGFVSTVAVIAWHFRVTEIVSDVDSGCKVTGLFALTELFAHVLVIDIVAEVLNTGAGNHLVRDLIAVFANFRKLELVTFAEALVVKGADCGLDTCPVSELRHGRSENIVFA